jgi:hypothetical protein
MAVVFAPVRIANRWTYRAAPTLEVETAARPPFFTNAAFRRTALFTITRVERVRLPASQFMPSGWIVQMIYGTIGNAPAVYMLDRSSSSAPFNARAGEAIEIGENHRARVAAKV